MKRKMKMLLLAAGVLCMSLVGCGSGGQTNDDVGNAGTSAPGELQEVKVWTTYGTKGMGLLNELANKFNNSQEQYEVTVEFGGTAPQIRQKIATSKKKYYPSILFGANNAIYEYATADYVVPIQEFIDKDEDKWTDDMYENVKLSYSDEKGNLIGTPMGVSAKGYFVNLDLLKAAGYSIEDVTSFEKIAEIATAAHDKGLCKYGYVINQGTDILNMLTYQGVDIFDADNGYSGKITKSLYNEGETKAALDKLTKIYSDLYDKGVAYPNADGASGGSMVFINKEVVFWSCTNSNLHQILDTDLGFNWTFIPLTGIDDGAEYKGAAITEGTGMFIANTENESEMQGAYEFIKFIAQAENQYFWCTNCGYVPYTNEAANSEEWTTWMAENFPDAKGLVEKMQSTSGKIKFPYSKLTGQLLTTNWEIISNIMAEPKGDLNSYIEKAADSMNQSIEMLNLRGQ